MEASKKGNFIDEDTWNYILEHSTPEDLAEEEREAEKHKTRHCYKKGGVIRGE